MLLEDLGEPHINLFDSLMVYDKDLAIKALTRFMTSIGQFHAHTYNQTYLFEKILNRLNFENNSKSNEFNKTKIKVKNLFQKFNFSWNDDLESEMQNVLIIYLEPGPFTTLVHGDMCPDNTFDDPVNHSFYIIDFEWSHLGSALLDATYLRMSNPTCWCAKAFPSKIVHSLEEVYRQELMRKIPAANDDTLYNKFYVAACAYWMLQAVTSIELILESDIDIHNSTFSVPAKWKAIYNLRRPRLLARLQAFVDVSSTHKMFPHLTKMAQNINVELAMRWSDIKKLDVHSAFTESVIDSASNCLLA